MSRRTAIEAGRLRLVPLTPDAAADLLAGGAGGLVILSGWPHPGTLNAVRAALESGDPDALPWLMVLSDAEAAGAHESEPGVIGDLGWKGAPGPEGGVEIGYGVADPYQRRGYATEAVGALVAWLDDQTDVRVVRAEVLADNVASRGVLERNGFSVVRLEGAYLWYERPTRN